MNKKFSCWPVSTEGSLEIALFLSATGYFEIVHYPENAGFDWVPEIAFYGGY